MKLRSILLTVLAILAASSAAYAGQPGSGEDLTLEAWENSAAPYVTAEATAEPDTTAEGGVACTDNAVNPLATDLMGEIVSQLHCGDGFHVNTCTECPWECFCNKKRVCCYCS